MTFIQIHQVPVNKQWKEKSKSQIDITEDRLTNLQENTESMRIKIQSFCLLKEKYGKNEEKIALSTGPMAKVKCREKEHISKKKKKLGDDLGDKPGYARFTIDEI